MDCVKETESAGVVTGRANVQDVTAQVEQQFDTSTFMTSFKSSSS